MTFEPGWFCWCLYAETSGLLYAEGDRSELTGRRPLRSDDVRAQHYRANPDGCHVFSGRHG